MMRIIFFLLLSIVWVGCDNAESTSRLEVRLTDDPGDFEEVNIDIQGLEVHSDAGNQNSGWISLDVPTKGVYDILKLSNGLDTLLAASELPAGRVSQIRLILGSNNSVKIDGITKPLATPSAQQSGLKLNLQQELLEGVTYTITLDFDAARSVVSTGNGMQILKPVIRALKEANTGAIRGIVTPAESSPAVFAISGTDTLASGFTDEMGKFLLRGVPPGNYTVGIDAKDGYQDQSIDNVNVTVGAVTDLGTIIIDN